MPNLSRSGLHETEGKLQTGVDGRPSPFSTADLGTTISYTRDLTRQRQDAAGIFRGTVKRPA